jgi:hypothetical protein
MKKYCIALCLLASSLLISGCKTTRSQPVTSTGEKIHIDVLCDRGDPSSMEERQWNYRNEVGAFMEPNLVRRLGDYGFSAKQIQQESDFSREAESYLLKVKILDYNPGSTAARMTVGFGAGAASMNCRYELVDANDKVVLSWDDGCGTSSNWQRIPIKLNQNVGAKLAAHYAQSVQ